MVAESATSRFSTFRVELLADGTFAVPGHRFDTFEISEIAAIPLFCLERSWIRRPSDLHQFDQSSRGTLTWNPA